MGVTDTVTRTVEADADAGAPHVTMRSPLTDLETEVTRVTRYGEQVIPTFP